LYSHEFFYCLFVAPLPRESSHPHFCPLDHFPAISTGTRIPLACYIRNIQIITGTSGYMKILIAIAPEKFRDEELAEPIVALEKAGITFDIASTRRGVCTGMLGARKTATLTFEEVDPEQYNGLIIIGGSGSQVHLWNDEMLIHLAKFFQKSGKVTAAICLAPVILARAKILKGKKATYFESAASDFEMKKAGAVIVKAPVVTDGRIITANGQLASKEFGEAVVKNLTSPGW